MSKDLCARYYQKIKKIFKKKPWKGHSIIEKTIPE